jgi:hypothetical protein
MDLQSSSKAPVSQVTGAYSLCIIFATAIANEWQNFGK